ncbi:flavoprotein [Pseudonocardia sp. HH130629-09]|uniref:flavoprotein n=1 Tax=Pseudonocardia sp. HH130629-09 TaxID=1641402 RepID=UPI0006CB50CF|nr:flavoprotein [Pseudonocardia sp. HH130629-09]ALE82464.1 flavoprotein [Pseudonocardia sp. HH130629-09]
MTDDGPVVGLVAGGVGGVETIRTEFVVPAIERGWTVAVTLTPTAGQWLDKSGELAELEAMTRLPVRVAPRQPGERSPHPPVNCYVVAPASANTVAKLALGIADNQALTTVGEAIGNPVTPVVVFPRVNAAHARHPAWERHLAALRAGGVHLVYGPEVWTLHEPRQAPPDRRLPWDEILSIVDRIIISS